jgi:hypothetical protein
MRRQGFGVGVGSLALGAMVIFCTPAAEAQVPSPSTSPGPVPAPAAPAAPGAPAASATTATPAAPAAPDDATARARVLFNEGTDAARRGEWAVALSAFEQSEALRAHAVTTYNVGYCERALGRYTRAREMLGRALAENAAHGGVELPAELATASKTYLAELEKQIAHAVVTLAPEGASILVDGRPLERAVTGGPRPVLWAGTRALGAAEPAPAATFLLDLDPGVHVFVVSRDGYAQNVSTRTFDPGSETNIIVQLAPAASATAAAPPAASGSEPTASGASAPSRVPFYLALGVGAAGLAAGSAAGIVAIVDKGQGAAHYSAAGTAADISTVAFIVGGVGAATAAVLWLTSPSVPASAAARQGASVAPWVTPVGGGVSGTF